MNDNYIGLERQLDYRFRLTREDASLFRQSFDDDIALREKIYAWYLREWHAALDRLYPQYRFRTEQILTMNTQIIPNARITFRFADGTHYTADRVYWSRSPLSSMKECRRETGKSNYAHFPYCRLDCIVSENALEA